MYPRYLHKSSLTPTQTDRPSPPRKRMETAQRLVRETERILHHIQTSKDGEKSSSLDMSYKGRRYIASTTLFFQQARNDTPRHHETISTKRTNDGGNFFLFDSHSLRASDKLASIFFSFFSSECTILLLFPRTSNQITIASQRTTIKLASSRPLSLQSRPPRWRRRNKAKSRNSEALVL